MRRNAGLVIALCAAILAVQITIPIFQLTRPRPARWGWQMYSSVRPPARMVAVLTSGEEREVDRQAYIPYPRIDMDMDEDVALVSHVCRTVPDIARVRVEHSPEKVEVIECDND